MNLASSFPQNIDFTYNRHKILLFHSIECLQAVIEIEIRMQLSATKEW